MVHSRLDARISKLETDIADLRTELKTDIQEVAAQNRENRLAIGHVETRLDHMDRRILNNERNILELQMGLRA